MIDTENFVVINATESIEKQQVLVREIIQENLKGYKTPYKKKNIKID
jgi:hypothetical protein